jgi:outer membrane biosynthesis protein TonB
MTERQKVSLAILASICLHLLLLGLLMLWAELWQTTPREQQPPEEARSLEVTLVAPPTPTPPPLLAQATPTPTPSPTPGEVILSKKMVRSFLDITGLHQTEKVPENAPFESDRNSEAASELPATGSVPLPSQKGKARPFPEFTNMDFSLGKARPAPMVKNESTPAPTPPPELSEPKIQEPQDLAPDLPEPVATPTPAAQDAFALAKPTPVPRATPKIAPPQPTPKPIQPIQPRLESAKTELRPGYQPEKEATKIEGGITNPGKAGVKAIGTPLGRYKKALADAVGSRWYYYIAQKQDLITTGEVRVQFFVNEKGHVEGLRILSNTANDTFATLAWQSVTEAQIPAPPPDVLALLPEGRFEFIYNFNLYQQN